MFAGAKLGRDILRQSLAPSVFVLSHGRFVELERTQPEGRSSKTAEDSTFSRNLHTFFLPLSSPFVVCRCLLLPYISRFRVCPLAMLVYRENYYYPDLWAGREKAKKEKQAELDLEMKRSQVRYTPPRSVFRAREDCGKKCASARQGRE